MDLRLPVNPRPQATLDRASAGRSRAARQPPNAPAISPPRIARPTAKMITAIVTGACRCSVTVPAVRAAFENAPRKGLFPPPVPLVGNPPPPPPPNWRAPPGVAEPVVLLARLAVSGDEDLLTSATPAKPRPTPITPPTMPIATASPITWKTILRLFQPSAFSVPNSRIRRVTAAIVSRRARKNEAMSTAIASHLPRLFARLAALEIEPVTSLASVFWSVTVEPGTALEIELATELMSPLLLAVT